MTELENDCLEYVTGAVARKFITKYPYLKKINSDDGLDLNWTETISRGNLIIPSDDLMVTAKVVEFVFNEYHTNNGLSKEPHVMKNVTDNVLKKMKNNVRVPVEVVKCLVRTRTFIRLNNMNKVLLDKNMANNSN